jgi:Zn-dependent protease with chaperone function
MSLPVCVLGSSVVITVAGPPLLRRATRTGAAPVWGMAAWITAMASVLGAWVVAAGMLIDGLAEGWDHLDGALGCCVAVLAALVGDAHRGIVQSGLTTAVTLTTLALALVVTRVGSDMRRARAGTRRHAEAAVLAARGTPRGPGGALVVDVKHRSVYCLPGRIRTIVFTRAALDALDEAQVAAVMAHERAHLTGRHHQLLAFTAALARIRPGRRLFAEGAASVARLAEMAADDAAARRHGRETVVGALLALSEPDPSPQGRQPCPGLGAARAGVADRVERLLLPPEPARAHLARVATTGALLLGPLLVGSPTVLSPLCMRLML